MFDGRGKLVETTRPDIGLVGVPCIGVAIVRVVGYIGAAKRHGLASVGRCLHPLGGGGEVLTKRDVTAIVIPSWIDRLELCRLRQVEERRQRGSGIAKYLVRDAMTGDGEETNFLDRTGYLLGNSALGA